MSCTTKESSAVIEYPQYWWCDLANGTRVYCDTYYCDCVVSFEADADIAGVGVIIGFVATTWYTIIVASIRAICETRREWTPMRQEKGHIEEVTLRLLGALCDLQAITGLAIAIAGLVQIPGISFYHEQFVVLFWELTLISFWAARPDYIQPKAEDLQAIIRKFTILGSSVVYLVFASLVLQRESSLWDNVTSGQCYLTNDHSGQGGTIFWLCGTSVSTLVIALDLAQDIAQVFDSKWKDFVQKGTDYILKIPKELFTKSRDAPLPVLQYLGFMLTTLLWILINSLAVWSYGDCFYPFQIACSIGLAAWNTWSLIDLKLMNRDLVRGSEADWRFGQVLPTAMLAFLVFSTIDAYSGDDKSMLRLPHKLRLRPTPNNPGGGGRGSEEMVPIDES